MTLAVDITLEDVYTKLRALVSNVVPTGTEIIQGLGNRVPMPVGAFVCMTARRLKIHRTPVESWDRDNPAPSAIKIEQGTLIAVQLDCYGPVSADWALMLTSVLRSTYAGPILAPVAPLYARDPMQAPLTNAELQYEQRWIVEANLQYNPTISTPMEFANAVEAELINVDEAYPP